MDRSETRRGVASTHARFRDAAADAGMAANDAASRGVSMAILVGDLAAVLADRLFLASGFADEALVGAARIGLVGSRRDGARPVPRHHALRRRRPARRPRGANQDRWVHDRGTARHRSDARRRGLERARRARCLRRAARGGVPDPRRPGGSGRARAESLAGPTMLMAQASASASPEGRAALEQAAPDELATVLGSSEVAQAARARADELAERAAAALDDGALPDEAASALRELAAAVAGS